MTSSYLRKLFFALSFLLPNLVDTLLAQPGERTASNIVLFVTDDHGQHAGCYGTPVLQTPHLDALAAEGVLFTNAFATTASCSASRSVILSGMHNHKTGQYGHTHAYHHFRSFKDLQTLPVLLQKAGYRTASSGKYHVAPREVYQFEEFLPGNHRNVVEMTDNAREFISRDSEQPFFLYMCTSDPHRGGGKAEELPHQPDRFGNQPEGYAGIKKKVYDPAEVEVPPFLPDNEVTRAEIAQYYQSISRIDQGFGHLLQTLKDAGVYENTLIIYMSDHGMAFAGAKTTVYEPGLKSPLIVKLPGGEGGRVEEEPVSWTDITPTLLDYAEVKLPEGYQMHGHSFLPVLQDENAEHRDAVFASHTFHEIQMYYPMRVVRDDRYKLIWNIAHDLPYPFASDLWASPTWQHMYNQGMDSEYGVRTVAEYIHRPEFELYDIQNDPYESDNLAEDPRFDSLKERYINQLIDFQKRTDDPWNQKWQYE